VVDYLGTLLAGWPLADLQQPTHSSIADSSTHHIPQHPGFKVEFLSNTRPSEIIDDEVYLLANCCKSIQLLDELGGLHIFGPLVPLLLFAGLAGMLDSIGKLDPSLKKQQFIDVILFFDSFEA